MTLADSTQSQLSQRLSSPGSSSQIRPEVAALQGDLVNWRRHLHQHPELGFREELTSAFVARKLTEWGLEVQTGVAKTGVVALVRGERPGRTLAIRADMDALPIQEENEVPYRSQHDGVMHACGHDGHTAIALGTAYYLSQNRHLFNGQVKFLFQPAEEGPGGAQPMIEAGVLRNPEVDAIIGLHLWNNLPLGTVGVRTGPFMAAVEVFECTLSGKGGHGAMPHQTIDSIVLGAQIVNALQTIVARNVDPLEAAVVTVGEFHAGTAHNVIAGSAYLSGTVRYFKPELAELISHRFREVVEGVCASQGARAKLDYRRIYPPVVNHPEIADLIRRNATAVVDTPAGIVPECQTMGGEDMAFFLQEVPGCYFFLGSANEARQLSYPHHHPRFDFDETALAMGVEIFTRCVSDFLS
ncbi:M20 family metallopeptidase [Leptolyngbya sp. FACHB-261]|uniref:M20 metallopeptidase family protein n=1 Tax=Leptolyngbya sp. FACHB-261 TaxID=2692806 RepID=UPI001685A374|nr:M20 family metallopeptidase [Leptolyngbya sp. FACHB-261]MBD2102199.1 amidohydrolase [Leptolyngbya sp. FACHB-261]